MKTYTSLEPGGGRVHVQSGHAPVSGKSAGAPAAIPLGGAPRHRSSSGGGQAPVKLVLLQQ